MFAYSSSSLNHQKHCFSCMLEVSLKFPSCVLQLDEMQMALKLLQAFMRDSTQYLQNLSEQLGKGLFLLWDSTCCLFIEFRTGILLSPANTVLCGIKGIGD